MMGSGETLVIERHGEPIGFFVPLTAKDRKAGRQVLGRLGAAVESVLKATDLTEDRLVDTSVLVGPRPVGRHLDQ